MPPTSPLVADLLAEETPSLASAPSSPARRWVRWWLLVLALGGFLVAASRLLQARLKSGKGLPAYSFYSERSDALGDAAYVLRRPGCAAVSPTRLGGRAR